PLAQVDPVYFEKAYYLGADKGGEKPYRLLADAMAQAEQVAVAKFVMRGKESLVLIRPAQEGLLLHTMFFADEVRSFADVDKGQSANVREGELDLALQLIRGLARDEFKPEQYKDEYRGRVTDMLERKVEGREVTAAPTPAERQRHGGPDGEPRCLVHVVEPRQRQHAAPRRIGRRHAEAEERQARLGQDHRRESRGRDDDDGRQHVGQDVADGDTQVAGAEG